MSKYVFNKMKKYVRTEIDTGLSVFLKRSIEKAGMYFKMIIAN